jgi:glycosyl hydrolase family 18 (putative chitinase)/HYDIN/CFA65/VesB family protein/ASPM-SPD-2-Hydin domain-containing protein/Ig-like domain-containing protein/immunoglobulin I-set domain protein
VTSAKGSLSSTSTSDSSTSVVLGSSPTALEFGNVSLGSTSNQSLTIINFGTSAVTISQASASGGGFTIGGVSLPVTLNPGSNATFTASFAPSTTGDVSGTVSFMSTQLRQTFGVGWHGTGKAVAPLISVQPVSQSILSGQTATFTVSANGTPPLSYQWYKNGTPLGGATSTSYITPAESTADNGAQFTVVVSNSVGNATSNIGTLSVATVPVGPSVTMQPISQTVFANQTATFSVVANGTAPLSYQWLKNGTGISGATSSSYTTTVETTSDNGALFYVIVSNSVGNVASNSATLTVNPDPMTPSIVSQPASQTITAGQTATFSVTASGTSPLSYQWSKNGAAMSGAISSSYTTPAETSSDNGAQFTVIVSNSAGTATSNIATLTINVPPLITTQPTSQTVNAGQTATFSVTASGTAPLSYQWKNSGMAISGATSSSYTTPAEATSDNGTQFTVIVSNSAGSVNSNGATLTVNSAVAAPSITTQPPNQTVVVGQTANFSVTASGTSPLSYQWSKNGTAINGATSPTYTTPPTISSDNGAQFTVLVSNAAGSATSNAATLSVNAATFLLSANPTTLAFGNVNTGSSSLLTVALTNSGNSNVIVSSVSISGPGFTASGVSAGTIVAAGKTTTLNVTFAPAATGSVTGSVSILSNASNSPATVTVAGSGQPSTLPGVWITGHYAAQNGVESVANIPWSKYTHVNHFAAAPGVDGSGIGNGTVELHYLSQTEINQIVAAAHAAGKKVLVVIKDNDSHFGAFGQSTAPTLIAAFVSNIITFVNSNGYDGVDFDWEQSIDVVQYEALLSQLRIAFGATKLITVDMGNWGALDSVAGASYSNVDQINLMCYDMDSPANGFSWYNDALLQAGNTGVPTCDWRATPFTTVGVPASKIGIGIPFYGRRWPAVTQALVSGSFSNSTVLYRDLVTDATRWQTQYQFYDATYKSNYLSIASLNEFDSYNGVQFVQDVVAWQKAKGFGGFMTFTLDYEYLSTQTGDARYPLSTALCQQVFGTCP